METGAGRDPAADADGAGGSGKTRLALVLASESLEKYPDGVWWIDLAAQADPAMVGDAIAEPIGVRPLPGMTPVQALSGALAQGRTLVVLDNCEHLLEACAEAATAILESCPGVTVLATSRAPLGVPGESASAFRRWRAGGAAREPVESLSQYDAVKLFIERAMKARSNFAVTNDNAPAVAQICSISTGSRSRSSSPPHGCGCSRSSRSPPVWLIASIC